MPSYVNQFYQPKKGNKTMKICPKCNSQHSDDTKFCNNCGTLLGDAVVENNSAAGNNSAAPDQSSTPFPGPIFSGTPNNTQPQGMPQPGFNTNNMGGAAPQPAMNPLFSAPPVEEPKKKKSPMPFILIGVAVCFVVVIAAILVLLLGGGYKKPINKLVSLVNAQSTDVNAYMSCVTPPFVPETYKEALGLIKNGDAKDELNDAINEVFEEAWDGIKEEYGKDWKVSIEFKKNKKLSDKDIDKLQKSYDDLSKTLDKMNLDDEDTWEDIADYLDDEYDTELKPEKAVKLGENLLKKLDNFKITEGYEVKVKVSIEGKSNKDSTTMSANVIKAGGQWFIDPLSFSEGGISAASLLNQVDDFDF